MSLSDELLEIERLLWNNDPGLYRENYTEDALKHFLSGGARRPGVPSREAACCSGC